MKRTRPVAGNHYVHNVLYHASDCIAYGSLIGIANHLLAVNSGAVRGYAVGQVPGLAGLVLSGVVQVLGRYWPNTPAANQDGRINNVCIDLPTGTASIDPAFEPALTAAGFTGPSGAALAALGPPTIPPHPANYMFNYMFVEFGLDQQTTNLLTHLTTTNDADKLALIAIMGFMTGNTQVASLLAEHGTLWNALGAMIGASLTEIKWLLMHDSMRSLPMATFSAFGTSPQSCLVWLPCPWLNLNTL